jgi:uncharacterized protein
LSRVFWDTMIAIYLLEGHAAYAPRAIDLLERSARRGDQLFTSYLALGEIRAGMEKMALTEKSKAVEETLRKLNFSFLSFDAGAVDTFSRLRAKTKLKIADAIHLACAASAGIDLFLTGDKQLIKLDVPRIHFIAEFTAPIL